MMVHSGLYQGTGSDALIMVLICIWVPLETGHRVKPIVSLINYRLSVFHLGMENIMGLLSKHHSFDCGLLNITPYDWEPGDGVF